MDNILYKEESYKIIGACMKVQAELGSGFFRTGLSRSFRIGFSSGKNII